MDRYQRTGSIEDLELAIQQYGEALDLTPEDHPDRAYRLQCLGAKHHDKFWRTTAIEDLQVAIQRYKEAVDATTKGPPDLAARLRVLGVV